MVEWLGAAGIDLLEISGGTYEQPSMMGVRPREAVAQNQVAESSRAREAIFLDYAASMRAVSTVPPMVTGGFRAREGMETALADGDLEVIDLGRPPCVDTDFPARLLEGRVDAVVSYEWSIEPARAGLAWFCLQLTRMAE